MHQILVPIKKFQVKKKFQIFKLPFLCHKYQAIALEFVHQLIWYIATLHNEIVLPLKQKQQVIQVAN